MEHKNPSLPFIPRHAASWWATLEDLQWSQKKIVDKIKRRAAGFAEAKIDMAINFGFHVRFDFANYFGQLHGYYANVCEELHKYDIKFMDHYSCNHVERPRGETEFRKLHKNHRHSVLLFHDPIAAVHAQYEGYYFKDICEVDVRDGSRGYSPTYQFEIFCHNNPNFLDMHTKYLQRLMKEVPFDGIEVDDMCDYGGPTTCRCRYCQERFRKDYGHELPAFEDKSFFGDTTKPVLFWGNYQNPVFRDWMSMKSDSVADHVKMVKSIIGDKPLMTCCSSSGPAVLNVVALNLEKMAPHLDFFMLENGGINVNTVNWVHRDAEATHQKDIAHKRGNAVAMALCYSTYTAGGYLGWCLSRFWGVASWSGTVNQNLEENPADEMEIEDIIGSYNQWEQQNSNLNYRDGQDLVEVRLVNNSYCRDNGWRGEDGLEHWDKARAWSGYLLKNNIGYRFVRAQELAEASMLMKDNTPLILDSVGCVSDGQFKAITNYLSKGGAAWLVLPFGTHDEKGFKRPVPLSEELTNSRYKNLVIVNIAAKSDPVKKLISEGKLKPVLKQIEGDTRWAARIRFYKNKPVIHMMNTALAGIPHPTLKDNSGTGILSAISSNIKDNNLKYEINTDRVRLTELKIISPELADQYKTVSIEKSKNGYLLLDVNLDGIKVYAEIKGLI
jgi:DNA-binding TFAR19-related protein (PDSD5 family)